MTPSEFVAIYYELQIEFENTILLRGISSVFRIALNSKTATYNIFQAETLHQPEDDGTTGSVYQFLKPYVVIATDDTNLAEVSAPTLQQGTDSNQIKVCRKSFSTSTDETPICLTSLYFN